MSSSFTDPNLHQEINAYNSISFTGLKTITLILWPDYTMLPSASRTLTIRLLIKSISAKIPPAYLLKTLLHQDMVGLFNAISSTNIPPISASQLNSITNL